jgi:predicted Fe-S protein YdhL (DUF1289 family)
MVVAHDSDILDKQVSEDVPSPCVNVCQMHPQKHYCVGCLRTIEEIGNWLEMRNEEKREVLARIEQRRNARP